MFSKFWLIFSNFWVGVMIVFPILDWLMAHRGSPSESLQCSLLYLLEITFFMLFLASSRRQRISNGL